MCIRTLLSDDKMKVNIYALNQFKSLLIDGISQNGKQYWIKQLAVAAMILEKDTSNTNANTSTNEVGLHPISRSCVDLPDCEIDSLYQNSYKRLILLSILSLEQQLL